MKQHSNKVFFGLQRKTILWIAYLVFLTPVCLEISLRIVGANPYVQEDYHITSIPESPFLADDSLGITLNPGAFKITLNDKHTFYTTHTLDSFRKVDFYNSSESEPKGVAVLGCSFTYGYGVNDEEHFTSILQKKHSKRQFTNYGVVGYGTTQSYLQLKRLEKKKEVPNTVILIFATDHFNRNVLMNSYRRGLNIGFNRSLKSAETIMMDSRYPVTLNTDLDIRYEKWNELYEDWKGRNLFSTVNWLQTKRDEINDYNKKPIEISFALIKEMEAICKKNDALFLVTLLDENERSKSLKKMLTQSNIHFLEVNFNFQNKQLTNYPFDNHPNSLGHEFIAKKLNKRLNSFLPDE
jgi:lysophospholipase L1-like esterase